MDPYLLLAASVAFAVANNIILHYFSNRGLRGAGDALLFNALVSVVWTVVLAVRCAVSAAVFSPQVILWGVLYGAVTSAFLFCKMQAMSTGPISVTSLVGCSSLLISTAVGVVFWRESIGILQLVGVLLLAAALALTVSPKSDTAKKSWKYWCAAFFLCSGAVGIIFKLHQSSTVRSEIDAMMLCAALTSVLLLSAMAAALSLRREKSFPRLPARAVGFALACGAVSFAYNRLNIRLSGQLPSIVFFPVFNGSVIFIAALAGPVLFREKLKPSQTAGILLGILSLILAAGVGTGSTGSTRLS